MMMMGVPTVGVKVTVPEFNATCSSQSSVIVVELFENPSESFEEEPNATMIGGLLSFG